MYSKEHKTKQEQNNRMTIEIKAPYTVWSIVCGHPFKLVDSAVSVTLVADTCVKHSHAISIDKHWEWNGLTDEFSDFQRGTVIGCHLSNKSVNQISAPVNCKYCYCEVETCRSNNGSSRQVE